MPLEASSDWCTASCPFNDGERLALVHLDVTSSSADVHVVVVVFDLLRNEAVRRLRHRVTSQHVRGHVTTSEHVAHVTVSSNDRYVIAGLHRASDDLALFVIFDLSTTAGCTKTLTLDAAAEVFRSNSLSAEHPY